MEIALPFDQAQEIALVCRDELGLSLNYRLLERRLATRNNPRMLENVHYAADDFLALDLNDGRHSNAGVWLLITQSDYAMFRLRFFGMIGYVNLPE